MSDILSEAADAVNERQGRYGTPADNMERIAALWTAYLEGRGLLDLERTDGVTATDCALMQALVKIARLEHGYHHDSVVDLAGYAACAAQINEGVDETHSDSETIKACGSGVTYLNNDYYCNIEDGHRGNHQNWKFETLMHTWSSNG